MTKLIAVAVGAVAVALIIAVILALPVQLLWNACLVPAFHEGTLNPIGFWQALGISVLCSFLFKSSSSSSKS